MTFEKKSKNFLASIFFNFKINSNKSLIRKFSKRMPNDLVNQLIPE